MTEKITKNTLIPVGLVIMIMSGIISIVWWCAGLNAKTDTYYMQVGSNTDKLKEAPSRTEFSTLQGDVREIKIDIKELLKR